MKTLLVCPAVRPAVPLLRELAPLAVGPILGECLVYYWLEYVAGLGATEVTVIAADRPEQVRSVVGNGRRWGIEVKVAAVHREPLAQELLECNRREAATDWLPAPHNVIVMNTLPGCAEFPLFDSYASWFAALQAWMPRALTPARVRMREHPPGVWVGSGARVAPAARLIAPSWIGDHAVIEADAVIGPNAVVEERAVVSAGARVAHSVIGPDTYVGRLTAVMHSLVDGNLLVNWRTESALRVSDSFLLCSLAEAPQAERAGGMTRAALRLVHGLLKPLAMSTQSFRRANRQGDVKLPG